MSVSDQQRKKCSEYALRCFGTGYIFEHRAAPIRIAINCLVFSSFIGPISIGTLVLSIGVNSSYIIQAIWAASILSSLQIVISLWSVITKWQDNLSYYIESKADNYHLANKFLDLGNDVSLSDTNWKNQLLVLETLCDNRQRLDLRYDISDEEKRMGMRAALRQFQRECVGCKTTPKSNSSSDCDVCGKFKKRRIKWLM